MKMRLVSRYGSINMSRCIVNVYDDKSFIRYEGSYSFLFIYQSQILFVLHILSGF